MPSAVGYPGPVGPPLQPADGSRWTYKDGRWQPVTGMDITDADFRVVGSGDPTKKFAVEVDGQTTATTTTLSTGAQNADRTLSVPVLAGADTIATLAVANVFTENLSQTGAKTFSTGTGAVSLNGATTVISGKQLNAADTTDATTTSTGAVITAGGVGIAKALWVGGLSNIAGVATFQNNIAQTGATTLSSGTGTQTFNGNVVVTTGKTITAVSGIIFSNETLSTYDEGTWTPTLRGSSTAGTQTYTLQEGRYIRVGNRIWCDFNIILSAKDAATAGDIQVAGWPFTFKNTGSYRPSVIIGTYSGFTFATGTQLIGAGETNTTKVDLYTGGTLAAIGTIDATGLSATALIYGTMSYEI